MHRIDPVDLPEHRGMLERFLINPHGEIDGLILDGSRQVHVPPHLSSELEKALAIGEEVTVRGVRLRGTPIVAAIAIQGVRGEPIVDDGPGDHGPPSSRRGARDPRVRRHVEGRVRMGLYGAKGELRGALLASGEAVRVPPHEAERFLELFEVGVEITVEGEAIETRHGTCVEAARLARRGHPLKQVKAKHHP